MESIMSDESTNAFDRLWPQIRENMVACRAVSSEAIAENYKAGVKSTLSVWARQYALLMVPSCKLVPKNRFFFKDTPLSSPDFLIGVPCASLAKNVERVMQGHQLLRHPETRESTMDRRARLGRFSYLNVCGERCGDMFIKIVDAGQAKFEKVHEQISDGDGGAGEVTHVWLSIPGFEWIAENVTLASAQDEFMMGVRNATDPVPTSIYPEWRPLTKLLQTIHDWEQEWEQERSDLERAASRTFSDPEGALKAKNRIAFLDERLLIAKTKERERRLNTGVWMVQKRLEAMQEVGYEYIGERPDKDGKHWFRRTIGEMETLANALMDSADWNEFGDVPEASRDVLKYESFRARGLSAEFSERAKKFLHSSEQPGLIERETADYYHLEEAIGCKVGVDRTLAEDAVRSPQHAPSLPKMEVDTLEKLKACAQRTASLLTPRALTIDRGILRANDMMTENYILGHVGPTLPDLPQGGYPELTLDVVQKAMGRVLKIIEWTAHAPQQAAAFRRVATALCNLLALQNEMHMNYAKATTFIARSAAFWKEMRSEDTESALVAVAGVGDVMTVILSHIDDARWNAALSCTCKDFAREEVLQNSLPRLLSKVRVGRGFPGTMPRQDEPPLVSQDMTILFHTTFGFYQPFFMLDVPDQWITLDVQEYMGIQRGAGQARVQLVYDEPDHTVVFRSSEPVLRMAGRSADIVSGFYTMRRMETPVRVLVTSYSVRANFKDKYERNVKYWTEKAQSQSTQFNEAKLKEAIAMRNRNAKQQCLRLRTTLEYDGKRLTVVSDPFVVVANLTKAQQRIDAKKRKQEVEERRDVRGRAEEERTAANAS